MKTEYPAAGLWKPFVWDVREYMGRNMKIRLEVSGGYSVAIDNIRMGHGPWVCVAEVPSWTWTAKVGSHMLVAKVDSTNRIMESDETNNTFICATSDIAITSPAGGEYWYAWETYPVTWVASTANSNLSMDVSTDSGRTWSCIDSSVPNTGTYNWTVNANASSKCFIRMTDTLYGVIRRTVTKFPFTIAIPSLPDYVVTDIGYDPVAIRIGQPVNFTVTVQNQGNAISTGSNLKFYFGTNLIGDVPLSGIGSGVIRSVNITLPSAASGNSTLRAVIDPDNTIAESDETNNEYTEPISIGYPDYVIGAVQFLPAQQFLHQTQQIRAWVKNTGTAGSGVATLASIKMDGTTLTTQTAGPCASMDSISITADWTVTSGTHNFEINCDTSSLLPESNELNNSKLITYTPTTPDLRISGITWTPVNPSPGQLVTFYAQIGNQGYGGDTNNYNVKWSVDGSPGGTIDVNKNIGLGCRSFAFANAGFENNTFLNWTTSGTYGTATVRKRSGSITDTVFGYLDHTNSSSSAAAYLVSGNFSVTDTILTLDAWCENSGYSSIEIIDSTSGTVVQTGTLSSGIWKPFIFDIREYMGHSIRIRLKTSNGFDAAIDNVCMGRNSSAQYVTEIVSWNYTATGPSKQFTLQVDSINTIPESDETNNSFTFVFNALHFTRPSAGEIITAGDLLSITWTYNNHGSPVKIELSEDSGQTWNPVVSNLTDNGSYDWTASGFSSQKCMLRIADTLYNIVRCDTSEIFTIYNPVQLPQITVHPVSQTVQENGSVIFTVQASGPDLHFGWQKNGATIPGAVLSSYTLTGVTLSDNNALFRCIVYNTAGSDTSNAAQLTVNALPRNRITITGLNDTDQVYAYASNGWIGKKVGNGNCTITNLIPGMYHFTFRREGKRPEYIVTQVVAGHDTSIDITLRNTLALSFSDTVRIQQGSGTPFSLNTIASVVMDDIDSDGDNDIIAGFTDNNVEIYILNAGQYSFNKRISMNKGVLKCIRIADWNSDNKQDIIAGFDDGSIYIYKHLSPLDFGSDSLLIQGRSGLYGFDICNFNYDGTPEFLLGYSDGVIESARMQSGDWVIAPMQDENGLSCDAGDNVSVQAMDINGDGLADMLAGNNSGSLIWYKNNGTHFTTMGNMNTGGHSLTTGTPISLSSVYGGKGALQTILVTNSSGTVYTISGRVQGDFNGDGTVNLIDFGMLVDSWRLKEGDPGWNSLVNIDLTPDPGSGLQIINLSDFGKLVDMWKKGL
jgi:subtilase family serine protease